MGARCLPEYQGGQQGSCSRAPESSSSNAASGRPVSAGCYPKRPAPIGSAPGALAVMLRAAGPTSTGGHPVAGPGAALGRGSRLGAAKRERQAG